MTPAREPLIVQGLSRESRRTIVRSLTPCSESERLCGALPIGVGMFCLAGSFAVPGN